MKMEDCVPQVCSCKAIALFREMLDMREGDRINGTVEGVGQGEEENELEEMN